jgi:hypothetical protein
MALIVITISDTPDGQVSVALVGEPHFHPAMPMAKLTGAQSAAVGMLDTLNAKEPARIALLND